MSDAEDLVTVIRRVLAAMDDVHKQAVSIINSAAPDVSMFVAVTELADHVRKLSDDDAALRSQVARRIRDARGLSLASLADHIGLSKARADQLVNKNRPTKEGTEP